MEDNGYYKFYLQLYGMLNGKEGTVKVHKETEDTFLILALAVRDYNRTILMPRNVFLAEFDRMKA